MTYIAMTKQQMDTILNNGYVANSYQNQPQTEPDSNESNLLTQQQSTQNLPPQPVVKQEIDNNRISTNDYSLAQAKALINDMPDYVLEQYVDKFMAKDASDFIVDKRQFAERAIEELYKPNDTQPLSGNIKLAYDSSMPVISVDTSNIPKYAKLFAHFDTNGQVPASPYVFIKWVNNQTGQVLLFEQKSIIADSDQNWVSFKPDDGWQEGSYDIRFYQFTSELQPIAQLTYDIYEAVE